MEGLGKAELVRLWKSELGEAGFVYRNSMFHFHETLDTSIQLSVSLQKHQRVESYKINPSILLQNPLTNISKQHVLLLANVRPDGVYLHVNNDSWWPTTRLPEALTTVKRIVIPWFRRIGNPLFLAEKVEVAIEHRLSLIDAFEPLKPHENRESRQQWNPSFDAQPEVPATVFYYASILHYLAGDREMALRRTEDWLQRLTPASLEYEQGSTQLSKLRHKTQ